MDCQPPRPLPTSTFQCFHCTCQPKEGFLIKLINQLCWENKNLYCAEQGVGGSRTRAGKHWGHNLHTSMQQMSAENSAKHIKPLFRSNPHLLLCIQFKSEVMVAQVVIKGTKIRVIQKNAGICGLNRCYWRQEWLIFTKLKMWRENSYMKIYSHSKMFWDTNIGFHTVWCFYILWSDVSMVYWSITTKF